MNEHDEIQIFKEFDDYKISTTFKLNVEDVEISVSDDLVHYEKELIDFLKSFFRFSIHLKITATAKENDDLKICEITSEQLRNFEIDNIDYGQREFFKLDTPYIKIIEDEDTGVYKYI